MITGKALGCFVPAVLSLLQRVHDGLGTIGFSYNLDAVGPDWWVGFGVARHGGDSSGGNNRLVAKKSHHKVLEATGHE